MIKGFQTYELAVELFRSVQKLEVPSYSKDQLMRAAQSVVLNLSEGWAKPTPRDKTKFYAISFGSLRELQAIFDLIELKDEKVLDIADHVAACLYKLTYKRPVP